MTWALPPPRGLATAIGSMPHLDPRQACRAVLSHLRRAPAWPQLPRRSYLENMYVQFSEGFPGVVVEGERIWVDRSRDLSPGLERLYAAYMEEDTANYALRPEHAPGLEAFLSSDVHSPVAVKGQVTGPVSWGLTVTDQDRRPVLYDDVLADALARHLRLKAAWQERALRGLWSNTIIFVDEPYFASLGSAFISVTQEKALALLEEVLGGIQGAKGVHCCGNTDWSALAQTSLDILSFDAYNYGESLTLYPEAVEALLGRGGVVAWGIVPNEEESLAHETASSLLERLQELMRLLSGKGISYNKLLERSLITPSCGLGSLSLEAAEKALELTAEVSAGVGRLAGG